MDNWVLKAKEAIEFDADFAFKMLIGTADEQHVEKDWAIQVFLTRFNKNVKESN